MATTQLILPASTTCCTCCNQYLLTSATGSNKCRSLVAFWKGGGLLRQRGQFPSSIYLLLPSFDDTPWIPLIISHSYLKWPFLTIQWLMILIYLWEMVMFHFANSDFSKEKSRVPSLQEAQVQSQAQLQVYWDSRASTWYPAPYLPGTVGRHAPSPRPHRSRGWSPEEAASQGPKPWRCGGCRPPGTWSPRTRTWKVNILGFFGSVHPFFVHSWGGKDVNSCGKHTEIDKLQIHLVDTWSSINSHYQNSFWLGRS